METELTILTCAAEAVDFYRLRSNGLDRTGTQRIEF